MKSSLRKRWILLGSSMLFFIGWNRYVGQLIQRKKAIVSSIPVLAHSLPLLIVCGTVQNAAEHLDKIRQTLRRLMDGKFRLVDMVFYEENSEDDTVDVLESWWQLEGWNVTVLSPPVPTSTSYRDRTVRLAAGRNRLWQEIQQRQRQASGMDSHHSSYVLMMDMDDVNWHLAHADQCLNLPPGWFGCCANSYKVYYDLWALRTLDDWMDCDIVYECAFGPPTRKPFRHIPASHPPIQVRSCFGGATLYNLNVLFMKRSNNNKLNLTQQYQGRNGTRPICEHVPFHDSLQKQDPSLKLYIQPKFLNDGPSDNRMTHFGGVKKRLESQYEESFRDATLFQYYRTMNTFDR